MSSNFGKCLLFSPLLFFLHLLPVLLVHLGSFFSEFRNVVLLQFLFDFVKVLLKFVGTRLLFHHFLYDHLAIYFLHGFASFIILNLIFLLEILDFFLNIMILFDGLFESYLIQLLLLFFFINFISFFFPINAHEFSLIFSIFLFLHNPLRQLILVLLLLLLKQFFSLFLLLCFFLSIFEEFEFVNID